MAGMRRKHREHRQQEQRTEAWTERKCWCCGSTVGQTSGEAILVVAWADDSYSGVFHVPLCDACLTTPHQNDVPYVMGGHITNPASWVYDRLKEDKTERSKTEGD